MMNEEKKNVVEEVIEDLMEDPDAPGKRDVGPPQTVENESEDDE